ncbi:MAG: hypothetical protein PHU23_17030, partial [Dehalococcoidales bacterium]|nr:hypothetical protein [Dehalococcoidales bacterium]
DTTLIVRAGTSIDLDIFTAIQDMLKAVGIKAKLDQQATGRYTTTHVFDGWEGLCQNAYLADTDPSLQFSVAFRVSSSPSGSAKSFIHYDQIDLLLDKVVSAKTFEEKQKAVWEVQNFVIDEKCLLSPFIVLPRIAFRYPNIHEDGVCDPSGNGWTPENAWIDK